MVIFLDKISLNILKGVKLQMIFFRGENISSLGKFMIPSFPNITKRMPKGLSECSKY